MRTPPRPSHHREAESSRAAAQFSGAAAAVDEIMEEDDEDEEVFDVDEPVAAEHIEYGNTTFQVPQNPSWRQKVNYKRNVEEVRKMRAINFRIAPKQNGTDYRFWSHFHQDYYETVIIPKTKAISAAQWVDWDYLIAKDNAIMNTVVAECKAKHVSDIMAFKKD